MGTGYGEYNIQPPNILGVVQLGEAMRARRAQEAQHQFLLQQAQRKMRMEQEAGQYLPGALKGDENALAQLFRTDPTRGMAVVNWLATRQDRDLNRKLIEARIGKLTGAGGGGAPAVNPWAVAPGGMPGLPAGPSPGQELPSVPAAGTPTLPSQGVPRGTPPLPGQRSGALTLSMPAIGAPADGSSGAVPPGTAQPPGPVETPEEDIPLDEPAATGPKPGTRAGGPPPEVADIYVARSHGFTALLTPKGATQTDSGHLLMWRPGVPGSAVWVPFKQEKEPKPDTGIGPPGTSPDAWAYRTLLQGDPSSPEYEAAYSIAASPKVTADGQMVRPDMRAYRVPTRFSQAGLPAPGAGVPPGGAQPPVAGLRGGDDTMGGLSAGGPLAAPPAPLGTPKVDRVPGSREIPPQVMAGMNTNMQAIRQIDRVLAELSMHPDSVGARFMLLPDPVAQRTDPEGVTLRALVADISSLKIHDRSGAAVTASETPRLKPFIPNVGDTPDTIRKKLQQFRTVYMDMIKDTESYYSPEGGYRQTPRTGGIPTEAPAGGAPGAGDLKKKYGLE